MKKYIPFFLCYILSINGISQNLNKNLCTLNFDLTSLISVPNKNEILIYKFQPDSVNHYSLYKTINPKKKQFIIRFPISEPFDGYIEWNINDSTISKSRPIIFFNEKINLLFKRKVIEVRSYQNDFYKENSFLLFALPSLISRDNPYSTTRVKKSYEIFVPENYMLELRIREHERNILKALRSYKNYFHSLNRLDAVKEQISPKTLDTCLSILSPYFQYTSTFKKILSYSIQTKKLSVGKQIMSFNIQDTTMKSIWSDSFYTKHDYTLIDFWASWCGPCREKTPNLLKQYNLTDTSKFQIIAISIDNDKNYWLKAIKDDKITWKNYIDQGGWQGTIAKTFAITSIPKNILVDRNGKIVALDIWGNDLHNFLTDKKLHQ